MQSVSGTFSLLSIDLLQIASAQPSLLGIFDIYNQQSLPDLQIIQANIVGVIKDKRNIYYVTQFFICYRVFTLTNPLQDIIAYMPIIPLFSLFTPSIQSKAN